MLLSKGAKGRESQADEGRKRGKKGCRKGRRVRSQVSGPGLRRQQAMRRTIRRHKGSWSSEVGRRERRREQVACTHRTLGLPLPLASLAQACHTRTHRLSQEQERVRGQNESVRRAIASHPEREREAVGAAGTPLLMSIRSRDTRTPRCTPVAAAAAAMTPTIVADVSRSHHI